MAAAQLMWQTPRKLSPTRIRSESGSKMSRIHHELILRERAKVTSWCTKCTKHGEHIATKVYFAQFLLVFVE